MIDHPEPDPLDGLLQPQPVAVDPKFRDALLGRTRKAVRRRVWLKRLGLVAGLAACFVAGLGTMHWLRPPPTPVPVPPPVVQEQPEPPVESTAAALEDRAVLTPDERAELFRQAGQRYLQEQGDLQAAVRCYGHALNSASPAELTIAPEDDWLLMALKRARQEEGRHVDQ